MDMCWKFQSWLLFAGNGVQVLVCDAQVTETFLVKGAGSYIQSFKTFAVSRVRMGETPLDFKSNTLTTQPSQLL